MLVIEMTPPRQIRMAMTQAKTGRSMKKFGMTRIASYGIAGRADSGTAAAAGLPARDGLAVGGGGCQGTALAWPPSRTPCRPATITWSPSARPLVTIQSLP